MRTIKKLTLCLAVLLLLTGLTALYGCGDVITASGETSTFEMNYKDFTRVEISAGFEVEITRADTFFINITIDKSLYEYVSIAQRGDTLHVGLKANRTYTAAVRQAVISLPDLRRLELSGGSKATVTGFSVTHAIDFVLSGASGLTLNPLKTGDASFALSGASTVNGNIGMANGGFTLSGGSNLELTGTATGIKIDASGSSSINLPEFPVTTADVKLGGISAAVIKVSDLMDVHLSGASSLDYIGSPRIGKMNISGGSKLNQK